MNKSVRDESEPDYTDENRHNPRKVGRPRFLSLDCPANLPP